MTTTLTASGPTGVPAAFFVLVESTLVEPAQAEPALAERPPARAGMTAGGGRTDDVSAEANR